MSSVANRLLLLNAFSSYALQIIKKLIERKQAQIRKVYPGLSCFKDGVRQIPIESIPGISMYRSSLKSKIFRVCHALCLNWLPECSDLESFLPCLSPFVVFVVVWEQMLSLCLFSTECKQIKEDLDDSSL